MTLPIVPLETLADLEQAVDLQKTYWGEGADNVIAAHMLFSIISHGGHVLAAKDGDKVAGVVIGFVGLDASYSEPAQHLYIFSKRMVVDKAYRGQGLGARLKFAQRELALSLGIAAVRWTFDPLLAPNAHLNLHKLGAISRQYIEDYYGTNNIGGLSPDGSSDRLLVDWRLQDENVQALAGSERPRFTLEDYCLQGEVVNPAVFTTGQLPTPGSIVRAHSPMFLVEVPSDSNRLLQDSSDLRRRWREHLRGVLSETVTSGYVVRDFVSGNIEGRRRSFYILTTDQ
jgi:chorismate synthase